MSQARAGLLTGKMTSGYRLVWVDVKETVGALVVEDDPSLAENLADVVREYAAWVSVAGDVETALREIGRRRPHIVLLDFALPDGTALDVLSHLEQVLPTPSVIAISGEAAAEDAFLLAKMGVRGFLVKPCSLAKVRAAIEGTLAAIPNPLPEVRAAVGRVDFPMMEEQVRRAMISEAMAATNGSIRGAAALLGISRQRLQHVLRKFDES